LIIYQKKIKHLIFGADFNQSVDNLPKKLKRLTFGSYFNQSVDNLPKKIKYLIFCSRFNQPVDNLPMSITHLTFGYNFNQKLNFKNMVNLEYLYLPENYNLTIKLEDCPNTLNVIHKSNKCINLNSYR
jgi:hypothetical protein